MLRTSTFEAYSAAGENLTDILTIGIPDGTLYFVPHYFNGKKWFKEPGIYYPDSQFGLFPIEIKKCKEVYFGFYHPIHTISHNYILVGKKMPQRHLFLPN